MLLEAVMSLPLRILKQKYFNDLISEVINVGSLVSGVRCFTDVRRKAFEKISKANSRYSLRGILRGIV